MVGSIDALVADSNLAVDSSPAVVEVAVDSSLVGVVVDSSLAVVEVVGVVEVVAVVALVDSMAYELALLDVEEMLLFQLQETP